MTLETFLDSIQSDSAPKEGLSPALQALWYCKKGLWDRAHDVAQEMHSSEGSWIHAHLHRVEGDDSNARYWYQRSGRPFPSQSLDQEWEFLAETFLK